ncbi:MAG: tyrosine-type recombinase/integrase [bacterium]|nr:tyrosine-type recombinase/integrase [bacterium]
MFLLRRAGVRYRHFHTTGHTFATMFLTKGNPITFLQKILGHSNIKTTMRYEHLASEYIHMQNTINKIAI